MDKMKRSEFVTYLDTTPGSTATYKILGIGITELAIAYNPNIESEKWIIEDTARHDHTSNEKQASVSQSIYKDDPCYEFIEKGLDKLNYVTNILDINRAKPVSGTPGAYEAKLSAGKVAITSYMGENATIEYDLYYEGDPVEGVVTFSNNVPTFTPNASI